MTHVKMNQSEMAVAPIIVTISYPLMFTMVKLLLNVNIYMKLLNKKAHTHKYMSLNRHYLNCKTMSEVGQTFNIHASNG